MTFIDIISVWLNMPVKRAILIIVWSKTSSAWDSLASDAMKIQMGIFPFHWTFVIHLNNRGFLRLRINFIGQQRHIPELAQLTAAE